MRAAASIVDVYAIRLVMDDGNFGTELAQNAGRRFVSRAVCDIDRDVHIIERHVAGKTALREFHITPKRVIDSRGPANFSRSRPDVVDLTHENEVLDLRFDLVVEFVTVVPEKFNAVVFVRIMRGRKDDAGVGAQ